MDGFTSLDGQNDVDLLAANNTEFLIFNDANSVSIGSVVIGAGTAFETQSIGVVSSGDVKITSGNTLSIVEMINTSGTVLLDSDSEIQQSESGSIHALSLSVLSQGTTTLAAENHVPRFAANCGDLIFNVTNELTIGNVNVLAGSPDSFNIAGITSPNVKISAQGLHFGARVEIDNTFFVDIVGDISQDDSSTISARSFGVMATGTTILKSDNQIDALAAHTTEALVFNTSTSLSISTVVFGAGSEFEMSASGIDTTNHAAKISSIDLTLVEAIDVGNSGLIINSSGDLNQSVGGTIVASGLGLFVNGATNLVANNDVDYLGAEFASAAIFHDIDDLEVSVVTIGGNQFDTEIRGINSSGDVKLIVGGSLLIAESLMPMLTICF